MLGMGSRGMGPLRAALEWTPIQAHATANAVSLFYVTECQQSAAYLTEWDRWRSAGVRKLVPQPSCHNVVTEHVHVMLFVE